MPVGSPSPYTPPSPRTVNSRGLAARRDRRPPAQPAFRSQGRLARGASNPIVRNFSSYDDTKVGPACVSWRGASIFEMYYEGLSSTLGPSGEALTLPCFATGPDGTNWTKLGRLLTINGLAAWKKDEHSPTSVVQEIATGNRRMHFHGGNNSGPRAIGVCDGVLGGGNPDVDGYTWTDYGSNPVLQKGAPGSWDETFVADAKVIPPVGWVEGSLDSLWRLYYCGVDSTGKRRVGLALSADGLAFTKYGGNPIFDVGAGGQWDDGTIMAWDVYWEGGIYEAWYLAADAGGTSGIGYAYSYDGNTFARGPANPVLSPVTGDNPQDSIHIYRDATDRRIVYGQYDLAAVPALRGKGEAFERRGARRFRGAPTAPSVAPQDYVTLANESSYDFDRLNAFSLAIWARFRGDRDDGRQRSLIEKADPATALGWSFKKMPGTGVGIKFRVVLRNAFANQILVDTTDEFGIVNQWVLLAMGYSGSGAASGVDIWVNSTTPANKTLTEDTLAASILNNISPLIGGSGAGATPENNWIGDLAYPLIWSGYKLTNANIVSLLKGGVIPQRSALVFPKDPADYLDTLAA